METSCSIRLDSAEIDSIQVLTDKIPGLSTVCTGIAEGKGYTFPVTLLELCDSLSYLLHYTCPFMAKDSRKRSRNKLMLYSFICMADSTCYNSYQYLSALGFVKFNILNYKGFPLCMCYSCLYSHTHLF